MKSLPIASLLFVSSTAFSVDHKHASIPTNTFVPIADTRSGRRRFLENIAGAVGILSSTTLSPSRAVAAEDSLKDIYFGAGCFWHVQHEFIIAERNLLGRQDNELTSRTGYAGGLKTDDNGRVCYHNFQMIADYGKLGHGEVVGITVPESSIGDFAVEYFKLFGDKGDRPDTMDKGGEYRSLLGLPGGKNNPMFSRVEDAAKEREMTLVDGKGNDPDTLGKRLVYVMDTKKFPFYQAEVYHQYHNDFLSAPYGKEYNNLAIAAVQDGRIKVSGCPDRIQTVKKQLDGTPLKRTSFVVAGFSIFVICGLIYRRRQKFGYKSLDMTPNKGLEIR